MNDSLYIRRGIREMSGYTPGEQPRRADIIKLNTNENPYPPSPRVEAALRTFDTADLRRYPDPLCMELRAALAARHNGLADNIFVGNGSDEVLALFTRAFVEDDGTIGFFHPSYSLYSVLARIRGVRTTVFPLDKDFSWEADSITDASMLFLAHPHAPSGRGQPRDRIEGLCRRFKGVVVIDEAYADFAADSFIDLALKHPNVLVARSFSKSYSLAGLRVGFAAGSPELIAALYKIKDSYNVDALAQSLALAAVEDSAWMEAHAVKIVRTRDRLSRSLRALGWTLFDSEANFIWGRPPGGKTAAEEVYARLRENRILVRYFPGPATGEYLRISIGTEDETDALLDVLKRESEI